MKIHKRELKKYRRKSKNSQVCYIYQTLYLEDLLKSSDTKSTNKEVIDLGSPFKKGERVKIINTHKGHNGTKEKVEHLGETYAHSIDKKGQKYRRTDTNCSRIVKN